MPTSAQVLEGLTRLSRDLWSLAAAWHVLTGAFLVTLVLGCRPSRRGVAAALAVPLLSVSLTAWSYGNPFNGSVFLFAGLTTLAFALRLGGDAVTVASAGSILPGAAMVAFGWLYPHFLENGSSLRYLWAAPLGLIPCPTLSLVVGIALLLDHGPSMAPGVLLGGLGAFYGLLGWLWLGVPIDAILLLGSTILLIKVLLQRRKARFLLSSSSGNGCEQRAPERPDGLGRGASGHERGRIAE